MDTRLRDLERQAAATGDAADLLESARCRLRVGESPPRLDDGARVGGPALARVMAYALVSTGRREIEIVRAAGVPERGGRLIGNLRQLVAGEDIAWVWIRRWCLLLPSLSAREAALLAVIAPKSVRVPGRPYRAPVRPTGRCCATCRFLVDGGWGPRCGSTRGAVPRGSLVPSLGCTTCPSYQPSAIRAPDHSTQSGS